MKKVSWLGIFLIILGVILLASELGYLNVKWYDLLRLWPTIFIFWGIDILMGERRWFVWVALLFLILFLSMIIFVLPFSYRMHRGTYKEWFFPFDQNIKNVDLKIRFGVRNVDLSSSNDKNLIDIYSSTEFDIKHNYNPKIQEGNLVIDLEIRDDERGLLGFLGEERSSLKITLAKNIDMNFHLVGGVGNCNLDFRGIKLNNLTIKGGVGNINVWIPKSLIKGEIEGGIGNINIYVPEGVILDFQTESGIGKIYVDPEIVQGKREGKSIILKVKSGIGNINIKQSKEVI